MNFDILSDDCDDNSEGEWCGFVLSWIETNDVSVEDLLLDWMWNKDIDNDRGDGLNEW